MYMAPMVLYGAHGSAMACIFSGPGMDDNPYSNIIPLRTPKSPTGRTSAWLR